MDWLVLKYGGSSLTSKGIPSILKRTKNLKSHCVIVLSAIDNTTNELIKYTKTLDYSIIKNILKNHNNLAKILNLSYMNFEQIMNSHCIIKKINEYIQNKRDIKFDNLVSITEKIDIIKLGEIFSSMIIHDYLKKTI